MPLQWRLQVLEAQMARRFDCAIRFAEADLFRLAGGQRSAALDALTAGGELPLTIIGDEVVGTGRLDPDAIARVIERLSGGV